MVAKGPLLWVRKWETGSNDWTGLGKGWVMINTEWMEGVARVNDGRERCGWRWSEWPEAIMGRAVGATEMGGTMVGTSLMC